MYYVYLIECSDRTIYTGMSRNPFYRLRQHQTGFGGATYTWIHGVVGIIHIEKYATWEEAYKREWQIKLWDHESKVRLAKGLLIIPQQSKYQRSYTGNVNPNIKPKNLMSHKNRKMFLQVLAA